MLLPLLGGAPHVWLTALVFFQAMLFAAYCYAHFALRWLSVHLQALLHLLPLFLACFFLPITLSHTAHPPMVQNPIPWLLTTMLCTLGLPFFMISASSPLLQKWWGSIHETESNPYFLYAASNFGSLLALLAYPFFLEPLLDLNSQSSIWAKGFYVYTGLLTLLVLVFLQRKAKTDNDSFSEIPSSASGRKRLFWLALAFVPSSLMSGVTNYLTTDIAAVPLLWIVPLALYLLAWVFAFSRLWKKWHLRRLQQIYPLLLLSLAILLSIHATQPIGLLVLLHLLNFFCAALLCHGALADEQPVLSQLTEFYLFISLGGFLGGLFNGIVAPLVFRSTFEYPLLLAISAALILSKRANHKNPITWIFVLLPALFALGVQFFWLDAIGNPGQFALGVATVLCYFFSKEPLQFASSLLLLWIVTGLPIGKKLLFQERSFFGVLRVVEDSTLTTMFHGNTIHGMQALQDRDKCLPLTYYHPAGPVGSIFTLLNSKVMQQPWAIVGLGAASQACYAKPKQEIVYFEIDPLVLKAASDTKNFTFLQNTKASVRTVLGDARLNLQRPENAGPYSLIVVDAFGSDAIPIHLLTKEALQLYLSRLTPDGILAFHISSRYFNLGPVLSRLAVDAGLSAADNIDLVSTEESASTHRFSSEWFVMTRTRDEISSLLHSGWQEQKSTKGPLWTDRFSALRDVLQLHLRD